MAPTAASPARPAVVLFDVNGTLSDLDGLGALLREAGADPAILPLWFAATLRDGFAITAAGGYADFSEIAAPILTALLSTGDGPRVEAGELAARVVASMAQLDLHPDVADGLRTLAEAGVRLVTLSNGAAEVAESLLERAGLRGLVARCLSVSGPRRWKPAPESYRYALEQCDVTAERAALIAAHPWDVDGALRAGLRAGWLSREGAPYPPHLRAPEAVASTMTELAAALIGQR